MNEGKPTNPYDLSGFFALRTPLLPFDELLAWGAGLEAAAGEQAGLADALRADRARLRERLRALVARPEVRDALFVASPSLDERLDVWLREPDSEAGQKLERALVRYVQRMAGRATPFGLCAGCSVGTLGSETRLVLAERGRYQRHTRLDMDYLVALTESLGRERDLRRTLTYRPNSSLYRAGGRVCYQEYRTTAKGRSQHAVSIADSDYLQAVLSRAGEGATVSSLAAVLLERDSETSFAEAEVYLHELIDAQVLVSDLAPAVTGPEAVPALVTRLRAHAPATRAADRLDQARQELASIDAAGPGAAPQRYRAVAGLLEDLPAKVDLAKLFQVDLVKPAAAATLGPEVVAEIRRGVDWLHRLARRSHPDELARFRQAFAERYQGQAAPPYEARWVPLVEVLDDEAGIGFEPAGGAAGSSLLEGLPLPLPVEETAPWGQREVVLLRKLSAALATGAAEIVLEASDLDELAAPEPPPLPDAFAVMATLAAASEAALARGDFRVLLDGVSGPSGAVLLGRFCHADPVLGRHVADHLRAEEALQPDAVFAEIVHLPEEGRIGNILARPRLREYEIVYLGTSGAPLDRQIPVTDLLVSVAGAEIVLRSQRRGRRVVPRLTSAHNFRGRGRGLYRFLSLLQDQGQAALGWDWGALRSAPFLPRVVSGRLVLSLARWLAGKDELKSLGELRGLARFRKVQHWRQERRLPRWVALADHDNELPVDFDNVLSVEAFVDLVKGRDTALLVELFPGPDQLCARGPDGQFVHELVVPFIRSQDKETRRQGEGETRRQGDKQGERNEALSPCLPLSLSPCLRSFPPGSEWLYVKLYTGPATADRILRDVVRPVTAEALGAGAADRWFFLRYADPDHHLRLRFHGDPGRLQAEVWPALRQALAPLLADGWVWKVQLDTYEREVERYGGAAGMELAEQLFQADSEVVLAVADVLAEDAAGDGRWRLALRGMDLLLDDLDLDLAARRDVLRRLRDDFAREFGASGDLRHQLGDRYRHERQRLEALFAANHHPDERLTPGLAALRRRSERLALVVARLRACDRAGRLTLPIPELAPSYLHLHANRMLRSSQRAQEMVLYDFLYRLYESQAARRRGTEAGAASSASRAWQVTCC
jgi:thiopeptide-type bacteriocin biosynthesis protein